MTGDSSSPHQEIVIVRRRGGDDGAAAKGGAWKIAYADFVTAMMAFFLVMWLINASNEETRAQVASYFNPIKLTDSSTGKRGLKDKKDSKSSKAGEGEGEAGGVPPSAADAHKEAGMMANPDRMLAAIEAKLVDAKASPDAKGGGQIRDLIPEPQDPIGDGIGDPFDPQSVPHSEAGDVAASTPSKTIPPGAEHNAANELPSGETRSSAAAIENSGLKGKPQAANTEIRPDSKSKGISEQTPLPPHQATDATPAMGSKTPPGTSTEETPNLQSAFARELQAEIATKLGTDLDKLPASVEIKSTDEGTLISLTDKQSFGMFRSGSAEPEPEMVRLVETIAGVLGPKPGYIVIRGHTDSRPYRNKKYDNWQLSTSRAHLAQYMLIRGGLDGSRIRRIEGVADRDPKIPEDPEAPENRRIEILLGSDSP